MDPRFKKILRQISAIVLVFFSWISIEPWNFAIAAQPSSNSRMGKPQTVSQKVKSETEIFEETLRGIKEKIHSIMEEDEYQKQLNDYLEGFKEVVSEAEKGLETVRQGMDRMALEIEKKKPFEKSLKEAKDEFKAFREKLNGISLRNSGFKNLFKGIPFPADLNERHVTAHKRVGSLSKELEKGFKAIVEKAKNGSAFNQRKYQEFLGASVELEGVLGDLVSSLETKVATVTPELRRSQLLGEVLGKRGILEKTDEEIRNQFSKTEAFLIEKGLSQVILDRHANAVQDYDEKFSQFLYQLDDIERLHQAYSSAIKRGDKSSARKTGNELESKLTDFNRFLKENVKDPPHQKLDPNNLPHRTPKVKKRKPRLNPEEFTEFRKPIQLAFNGDPYTLLLVQATGDLPTPEDLEETIEVQFTQEIQDLAAQLDHNPVKIYNFIRENIAFVPTFASIQGSNACLLSKECNAYDAASLLIALFRVSGIPARYVIGTVEIDPDMFGSAMGDFEDLQAAARLASSGGIPVTLVNSGNTTVAVRMEHVWVEAYVDYIPSRGAVHKEGDTWIPLDAVLKRNRFQIPLDITTGAGVDLEALRDDLIATGTVGNGGSSITGLSEALASSRIDEFQTNLLDHMNQNLLDVTVGELFGAVEIQAPSLSVLPATLSTRILTVGERISALPSTTRHQLTLQLLDRFGINEEIRLEQSTAELAGKRITIGYRAASDSDVSTIESFGGLLEVPPYLVSLQPVLYVDGGEIGTGSAVTMGTTQMVRIVFQEPDGNSDRVEHIIAAGTYSAVGLDLQRISDVAVQAIANRLETTRNQLGVEDVLLDNVMGEVLHLHAQTYFLQVEASNRIIANQMNVVALKRPAEMLATYTPEFAFLFGAAVEVINTGMNVDVRRYVVSVSSRTGDLEQEKSYVVAAGVSSSLAENAVFEQLQQARSVSAVKLISEANTLGISIFIIDQTNVDLMLPQLSVSPAIVNDVQNAVAAGKQVIIPQQELSFLAWNGLGYIVLDVNTGAAAYLISGGLAGGGTSELSEFLMSLSDLFSIFGFITTIAALIFAGAVLSAPLLTALGIFLAAAGVLATTWYVYNETGSKLNSFSAAVLTTIAALYLYAVGFALVWSIGLGTTVIAAAAFLILTTLIVSAIVASLIFLLTAGVVPYLRRGMYAYISQLDYFFVDLLNLQRIGFISMGTT